MRWIRVSLYLLPPALVLVAIRFLGTLGSQELTEPDSITFAIGTEPLGIDPLTEQDPVSEEIEGLLFDSLLGRGPQRQLEGHLAESWSADARCRLYFASDQVREHGWSRLEASRSQWDAWALAGADCEGDELILSFRDARAQAMAPLLAVLPPGTFAPIIVWRLEALHSARATMEHFRTAAREGWQIRRLWSPEDGVVEFESAGHSANFERELRPYLDSNSGLEPKLHKLGERPCLVEPRLTIHLRSGVRWHDGRALSVADVVHSIELARRSKLQPLVVSGLLPIQEIEAPGPLILRVTYRDLFAPQLEVWERLRILPAHAWHAYSPRYPELKLVGTGPFRIRDWNSGGSIVLERNEDYFRGLPPNRRIVYDRVQENRLRRALFQIGVIDSYEADPRSYRSLELRGFQLARSAPDAAWLVAWNLDAGPLRDPRVRQALGALIDRSRLIERLLGGNGVPPGRIFADAGEDPSRPPERPGFDQARAESLLDQAGWTERRSGMRTREDHALSFGLTYAAGDDFQRSLARELQQQWRAAGIRVLLRPVSFTALTSIRSGNLDFEAVLLNEPSSASFLDHYGRWHSSQTGEGRGNFNRLRDPEVDRTLVTLRQAFDPATQRELLARLERQIEAQHPSAQLFRRDSARVFQRGRLRVMDASRRGAAALREIGAGRVSLTHDLAWWVKLEPPAGAGTASPEKRD